MFYEIVLNGSERPYKFRIMLSTRILPFLFVLVGGFFNNISYAQESLLVFGQVYEDGVVVRWQPLNPDQWAQLLNVGYRVEKKELPNGPDIVLSNSVLPKDTTWFKEHSNDVDGMMEAIGALIHDTTFQYSDKSVMDANTVRYNYIFYEAQFSFNIAQAVGAAVVDSTYEKGKQYRYTIRSLDGSISGSIEVETEQTGIFENTGGRNVEYTFPNDLSLSDMSPAKKNYVPPQLFGIVRPYGDSIVLRWGPNTMNLWKEANKVGYVIERIGPERKVNVIAEVKPWAEDQITPAIIGDSMAMLAASNLYPSDTGLGSNIYEKASLEENRFGFSLLAAERSPLAAEILGLRFVDYDVEEDKKYTYIIRSEAAPGFLSDAQLTITNTYVPPPAPVGFSISPTESKLILNWSKDGNEDQFNSYELERSEDQINWTPLTAQPLVFIETPEMPLNAYGYIDSVGINYKTFYYRLRGYDSFGDLSEPATAEGQAIDLTPPPPPYGLEGVYEDGDTKIDISWKMTEIPEDFRGFWVLLGANNTGYFDTLTINPLSEEVRTYRYEPDSISGNRSYYFKVLTSDNRGNQAVSEPFYVHVPDLKAPPPPEEFNGVIGDDGTVSLVWKHSPAEDLEGYWVYFANDPSEEFSPVNKQMIQENTFSYQIPEKSLNKSIFYMVSSEDRSSNRGKPSQILELKRPDNVPPILPFQFQPIGEHDGISLSWQHSPSEDVMTYRVYRRVYGSTNDDDWVLLTEVASTADTVFNDQSVSLGEMYEYRMLAIDESGNQSEYTMAATAKRKLDLEKVRVDEFNAIITEDKNGIQLAWTFDAQIVPEELSYKVFIYKSIGGENPTFYKEVSQGISEFTDSSELINGVAYNYAIQIRLSNGQSGQMSPQKSVMVR